MEYLFSITTYCIYYISSECSAPSSLANGQITGSVYTIGATLSISCNADYEEVSGITLMECKSTKQWNYNPTCVALGKKAVIAANVQVINSGVSVSLTLSHPQTHVYAYAAADV